MFSKFFSYLAQVLGGKGPRDQSSNHTQPADQSQEPKQSQQPNQSKDVPVPCALPSVVDAKSAGSTKVITVHQGDLIPCDGLVLEGFALVDESAIVGVSTPAMIEAAPGRDRVLADTLVVEGTLTIKCSTK